MPTTYEQPERDETELVADVMRVYVPKLHEAGVRVRLIKAWNENDAPLKSGKYKVIARIRVIPLMWRALLDPIYDALIEVDRREWQDMTHERRCAVIHHELLHLELLVDEETGKVKLDDLDRPRLATRPGDWNGGDGFAEVVETWGDDAQEYRNALHVMGRARGANPDDKHKVKELFEPSNN